MQTSSGQNPRLTVVSLDASAAYDGISCETVLLSCAMSLERQPACLPTESVCTSSRSLNATSPRLSLHINPDLVQSLEAQGALPEALASLQEARVSMAAVGFEPPSLSLPLTAGRCRCRRPHDACGDHLAACLRSGVLAWGSLRAGCASLQNQGHCCDTCSFSGPYCHLHSAGPRLHGPCFCRESSLPSALQHGQC